VSSWIKLKSTNLQLLIKMVSLIKLIIVWLPMLSNNSLTEETEILLFSNKSNVKPYYCQIRLKYGLTVKKHV